MAVSHNIRGEFSRQEILDALDDVIHPVEVAIFDSQNYFNFGCSIRTCHNFLVRRLWGVDLADGDAYYKKAAMTARTWMKSRIALRSSDDFLKETEGRNIIAFERREDLGTKDIRTFQYPKDPILLFGSEKTGISDRLLARADHVVSIPMYGFVLDHNVSVAVGIALYDWINKHTRKQ